MKDNVKRIGKPAAMLSATFAITYSVFQLLASFNIIKHPHELFWLFLPSLLLAPCFLITVLSFHYSVTEENKIFTAIATAFALLYCTLVTIVYFTQLSVVIPLLLDNKIDETHVLAFAGKSFLTAVDCMGYAAMSASTLFAAFAFFKERESKWLYRSLLFTGLLTPVIVLAFFIPVFLFIGALWIVSLPVAMIMAVRHFSRQPNILRN